MIGGVRDQAGFTGRKFPYGRHVKQRPHTIIGLSDDLAVLGVRPGDGLFVHASMRAIGGVVGGPRMVVQGLLDAVGPGGLVGMPGFSNDAYFPAGLDRATLPADRVVQIEAAVPGFDPLRSPTAGMGIIAETLRTWPGTRRSAHPAVSVCLNGANAQDYAARHSLDWATGPDSPLGRLCDRPSMKMLLVGVGWNRCSALHTAETLAATRRTKIRRMKLSGPTDCWVESPDVADDLNRLFPQVGGAFERTGAVRIGRLGDAECKICDYRDLVFFARDRIDAANLESGDRS
ncbi:MAG: AAC(3) family N-acetyltransferase [Pseudomonadota bacterium]